LADRASREELWLKARDLMMEDRQRLKETLEIKDCSFRPNIEKNMQNYSKKAQGAPVLASVWWGNRRRREQRNGRRIRSG
jgi:hypothetical protein